MAVDCRARRAGWPGPASRPARNCGVTFRGFPPEAITLLRGARGRQLQDLLARPTRHVYDACGARRRWRRCSTSLDAALPAAADRSGPYRDVRFSKDKSPYKTAIGARRRGARAGRCYYVQLSAKGLLVGSRLLPHGHRPAGAVPGGRRRRAHRAARWTAIVAGAGQGRATSSPRIDAAEDGAAWLREGPPADRAAAAQGPHRVTVAGPCSAGCTPPRPRTGSRRRGAGCDAAQRLARRPRRPERAGARRARRCAEPSATRGDAVGAALVAGHEVLRALDDDVVAEHRLEQLELALAQALQALAASAMGQWCSTSSRLPSSPVAHLGEVALGGADVGQAAHPHRRTGVVAGLGQRLLVGGLLGSWRGCRSPWSRPSSPSASRIEPISSTVRSAWRSGNSVVGQRREAASATGGRPRPDGGRDGDRSTSPIASSASRCWRTAVSVSPKLVGQLGRGGRLDALEPLDDAALGVGERFRHAGSASLISRRTRLTNASARSQRHLAAKTFGQTMAISVERSERASATARVGRSRAASATGRLLTKVGVAAGRGACGTRAGPAPSRTAARTSASRSTRARSRPACSPATGTTPASTWPAAARSTRGPTTPSASTWPSTATTSGWPPGPTPTRSGGCSGGLRDGLEQGLTLVTAKATLGLLERRRRRADRAHRARLRRGLPGRRVGLRADRPRRHGQRAARTSTRPTGRWPSCTRWPSSAATRRARPPRFAEPALGRPAVPASSGSAAWYRRFVETRSADAAERVLATAIASAGDAGRGRGHDVRRRHRPRVHRRGPHARLHEQGLRGARPASGPSTAGVVLTSLVGQTCAADRSEESSEWRHPHDLAGLVARADGRARRRALADGAGGDGGARRRRRAGVGAARRRPGARSSARCSTRSRAGAHARAARPGAGLRRRAADRALPRPERPRRLELGAPRLHDRQRAPPGAGPAARRPSCSAGALHGALRVYLDRFLNVPAARLPQATQRRRSPSWRACWDVQGEVDEAGAIGLRVPAGRRRPRAELDRRARPRPAAGGRRVPLVPGVRGRACARRWRGRRARRSRRSS